MISTVTPHRARSRFLPVCPNGATHTSPGQRPGKCPADRKAHSEGVPHIADDRRDAPRGAAHFQRASCFAPAVPGAMPRADMRSPFRAGLHLSEISRHKPDQSRVFPVCPDGATHTSPGQRPGKCPADRKAHSEGVPHIADDRRDAPRDYDDNPNFKH
jgi:hypothetical protein